MATTTTSKTEVTPLAKDPNPKIGQSFRLANGPDRATPLYEEWTMEDGSKAQRFQTNKGTVIIRRTCAPEERCRLRIWSWWEVELW